MLSLPLEVVEDFLVFLAIDGALPSISAVAQTCRRLRQHIYSPTDSHLWHRIFLTTFDEPISKPGAYHSEFNVRVRRFHPLIKVT